MIGFLFCAILCDEAKRWDEYMESGLGLAGFVGMVLGMLVVVGALILEGEGSSHGWLRMNEVVGDWEEVGDDSSMYTTIFASEDEDSPSSMDLIDTSICCFLAKQWQFGLSMSFFPLKHRD